MRAAADFISGDSDLTPPIRATLGRYPGVRERLDRLADALSASKGFSAMARREL